MAPKKYLKSRNDDRLSIPDFFHGKSVFITGGTGFLGKVLIEKLLRSCPDIDKIYIIMRPKKGKSLDERLAEMIALPLFVKVRREDSTKLKKIIALKGDVAEKNLGLSEEDRNTLIDEVSVVFHVAASVRFDDPLKQALLMNTRGTLEVLQLATKMKNLQSFLHVSTTYCNTHKEVIEERIYPAPGDWRALIKLAEEMDRHTLDVFAPKILGVFPNTYTFTKGLAEHVVKEFQDMVPAVIFRPSIVISSHLEPVPGWIDNFNGPVGLLVASGKGFVRTVYSDPDIRADYVPVDVAVKAMIAAAWDRAMSWNADEKLPIYNCSSHSIKSISQRELVNLAYYVAKEVPLNDILWYAGGDVTNCKFKYYMEVVLLHIIPALFIDSLLKMLNKKPMLLKLQRKIFVANMALTYFLTRQWTFKNDHLFMMEDKILDEDKNAFSFKVLHIDLIEYFTNCTFGVREYLLKEDNTDLPEAKKHFQKMYWLDKGVRILSVLFMAFLAIKFQFIQMLRITLVKWMSIFMDALI